MNGEQISETKCYAGHNHGVFITPGDGLLEYDENIIKLSMVEIPADWSDEMYGYCSACKTALRWDVEQQRIVDWPEANVVPHCLHCHSAIGGGQHYLEQVLVRIGTSHAPNVVPVVVPITLPPVVDGPFCGLVCLFWELQGNERMHDAFNR